MPDLSPIKKGIAMLGTFYRRGETYLAGMATVTALGFLTLSSCVSLETKTGETQTVARASSTAPFHLQEATITDVQRAIQKGEITCKQVVQAYIDRAHAYNGVCTKLVTKDGASIPAPTGVTRAGAPLVFPTATVPVSTVLPNFSQYKGLPIEYGRMEPTESDPSVKQQYGMVMGISNAGGVNALSALNIRGERSQSCKTECDVAMGKLPAHCPAACDQFRQQPDALEYAASLDKQYGKNPDLTKMPMYCAALSFKDVLDTKDMRTTGGADVRYAMDAPPTDSTIVARLRAKGAIIYAKANLAEYNGGSGNPGGDAKPKTRQFGAGSRSTWAGTACNPYDTARETGGSSSGSAASVGANLVSCSICEETGGSCRQPAWRNGVVGLVVTKGLMPYGGAIGADPYLDRPGVQCRTVKDTALVLDALKDPQLGYFDPRDIYTALPKGLVSKEPYASFIAENQKAGNKPLAGMRIGIVREYMVKHTANDKAVSDQIDTEIKTVLRDQLGAELVESFDPMYPDDPSITNMAYTFQQALAEILPMHMPEYLQLKQSAASGGGGDGEGGGGGGGESDVKKPDDGKLAFEVEGFDIKHRDYSVKVAEGVAPLSDKLNIRRVTSSPSTASFSFNFAQYLMRRGDSSVYDWATLNANAKYYVEGRTVAMTNWQNKVDLTSAGITQRVKMREVMRMVVLKVMQQNRIDVFVNPTTTVPAAKIGYASQPAINNRPAGRFPTSADLGIPELTVPAGFNSVIYEPTFELNEKKDNYASKANETKASTTDVPMPVGISFWGGPGDEPTLFKVASAYEAATKHRKPPLAFGPLKTEP
jgi:Asp-tRNA(Asn)/Glu-tRNA(Gln) amidotransferase A subunit family amidase